MAPKPLPKAPKTSLISVLAACAATFAVVMVGIPLARDWYSFRNPTEATLTFDLNPAACRAAMKGEQISDTPCTVEAPYGFDPVSKDLVLFLDAEDVRIATWEADLRLIDGEPFERSTIPFIQD